MTRCTAWSEPAGQRRSGTATSGPGRACSRCPRSGTSSTPSSWTARSPRPALCCSEERPRMSSTRSALAQEQVAKRPGVARLRVGPGVMLWPPRCAGNPAVKLSAGPVLPPFPGASGRAHTGLCKALGSQSDVHGRTHNDGAWADDNEMCGRSSATWTMPCMWPGMW